MPIPLAFGALLGAIGPIQQLITGATQTAQAKNGMKSLVRPEYKTAAGTMSSVALDKMAFSDPAMPGESSMRDRVDQAAANAVRAAKEAGGGMNILASIAAGNVRGQNDIGTRSAQFSDAAREKYGRSLRVLGQSQDTEWQMNKFAPYKDKWNMYNDMLGAGKQNMYNAGQSASALASALYGGGIQSRTGNTPKAVQQIGATQQTGAGNGVFPGKEGMDIDPNLYKYIG